MSDDKSGLSGGSFSQIEAKDLDYDNDADSTTLVAEPVIVLSPPSNVNKSHDEVALEPGEIAVSHIEEEDESSSKEEDEEDEDSNARLVGRGGRGGSVRRDSVHSRRNSNHSRRKDSIHSRRSMRGNKMDGAPVMSGQSLASVSSSIKSLPRELQLMDDDEDHDASDNEDDDEVEDDDSVYKND